MKFVQLIGIQVQRRSSQIKKKKSNTSSINLKNEKEDISNQGSIICNFSFGFCQILQTLISFLNESNIQRVILIIKKYEVNMLFRMKLCYWKPFLLLTRTTLFIGINQRYHCRNKRKRERSIPIVLLLVIFLEINVIDNLKSVYLFLRSSSL